MSSFHLFVYGTLRSGGTNVHMLDGCRWLGAATVSGMLYDIERRFPALVLYGDGEVHGELWQCAAPLLLQLDRFEGTADGLFRRVAVHARDASGAEVPCWLYAAGPALSRQLVPAAKLPAGRW